MNPFDAASSSSMSPVLSRDGRFVAFLSWATNLVPGQSDANAQADVFLFDRSSGAKALVSHAAGVPSTAASNRSYGPLAVSADGSVVAFLSNASNVVPGQVTGGAYLFLFLRQTGENVLASHAVGAPNQGVGAQTPSLSGGWAFCLLLDIELAPTPRPASTGSTDRRGSPGCSRPAGGSLPAPTAGGSPRIRRTRYISATSSAERRSSSATCEAQMCRRPRPAAAPICGHQRRRAVRPLHEADGPTSSSARSA